MRSDLLTELRRTFAPRFRVYEGEEREYDELLYSDTALMRRASLRVHPDLVAAIDAFWCGMPAPACCRRTAHFLTRIHAQECAWRA